MRPTQVLNKAPNGNFPVSRIRIVEKLDCNFKKGKHWFQVRILLPFLNRLLGNHDPPQLLLNICVQFGDDKEVIYLGAESEDRQHEWIKALKEGEGNSYPVEEQ